MVTVIGGIVVLFLALGWAVLTHLPSPAGGPAAEPTAGPAPASPGFTAAERACIDTTESHNRKLFDKATMEWQNGTLPIDLQGNPAYREYADAVDSLNLRACPPRYADAYATWVSVWRGYGTYLEDMSKPHLPWNDQWSEKAIATKRAEYEAGVRGAYAAIQGTARSGGVHLPDRSWTPKV
jgi:hypothetical protein